MTLDRGGEAPTVGLPTFAVAFSTLFWGTAWMPMRLFKGRGLDATATVLLLFTILTIVLTPAIYTRRLQIRSDGRSLVFAGLAGGTSITFYFISVTMTSIAHATLLFYLTPLWATLIERVAFKTKLRPVRLIEIALGLLGLCVVLGPSLVNEASINVGDALAFAAGITFALSSFCMYSAPGPGAFGYTWAWAVGSAASAGIIAILFDRDGINHAIALPNAGSLIFLPLVAIALLLFLPMNMLTIWGARLLSPTRVTLLLMCEVAVAFISSALFAIDAFGLREAVGCIFIISGALISPICSLASSDKTHQ